MEDIPHELPEDMDGKLKLLDKIMRTGIERLLMEARKRAFLKPPYGRPAEPNPLVTEDEFLRTCTSADLKAPFEEPHFHYLYGFNPLTFLADYFHWAHPHSFKSRKEEVERCFSRLRFRSAHATKQLQVSTSLRDIASFQRSGLLWGPICSSAVVGSASCMVKVCRAGTVVVEVSESKGFEVIMKSLEVVVPEATVDLPTKIKIEDIQPARHYFVRACLRDSDYPKAAAPESPAPALSTKSGRSMSKFNIKPVVVEAVVEQPVEDDYSYRFGGPMDGFFAYSQFWSLPVDVHNQPPVESKGKESNQHKSGRGGVSAGEVQPVDEAVDEHVNIVAVGSVYPQTEDTLPKSDANANSSLNLDINKLCEIAGLAENTRLITCLLGDIFSNEAYSGYHSPARDYLRDCVLSGSPSSLTEVNQTNDPATAAHAQLESEMRQVTNVYLSRLRVAMTQCEGFRDAMSLLRQSNTLLAWNDQRVGSDIDLRYEEYAAKKHQQEVKRYEKKYEAELKKKAQHKRAAAGTNAGTAAEIPPPPTVRLPPMSPSVHALLQVNNK